MCQIQVFSGIDACQALVHILFQVASVCCSMAAVENLFDLISQAVLAKHKVLKRIIRQKINQLIPESREILCFESEMDFNILVILFFQCQHGVYIAFHLIEPHPHAGIVAFRERIRRMVGKTENFKAALNRALHILPLRSVRMAAPPCMGMVICNHDL